MGKPRLAIFNTQPPHLYHGGVERRIIEITKRLQDEMEVSVFCGTKAGFKAPSTVGNVRIIPCYSTDKIYPLDNWFFNRSLSRTAEAYEADVYEAHNVSGYGFPDALKKRSLKKPFIHVVHGPLLDEYEQARHSQQVFRSRLANMLMKRLASLEKKTSQQATLIVAVSSYSADRIVKLYNVNAAKIRVVPNGVDTERFMQQENSAEIRQQFGLGDEPCVLFVGGLVSRKGLPYLVEAAKKVVKQKVNTQFLIVGDGPLRIQLKGTIASAGLGDNFKFLGSLKDSELPKIYNCADVFVLPSVQEGQGIVLLEAQSSGVPVVAFNSGGVKEAMRNGETGLLVQPGNTDDLAEALIKLLNNKPLRESLGLNGRKYVEANYTWDVSTKKMLEVYREALSIKR
jgi:glycosyltransferase involved in cell wall biosynthesis